MSRTQDGINVVGFCEYGGAMARAIQRFKFGGQPQLARRFARALAAHTDAPPSDAALVPVPLHPMRLAERGYNQAALLARELAKHTTLPVHCRALERTEHTPQQSQLDRAERLRNLRGKFRAQRSTPRHIVLVDDVVTTGATITACRDALAETGSQLSGVLCVAVKL